MQCLSLFYFVLPYYILMHFGFAFLFNTSCIYCDPAFYLPWSTNSSSVAFGLFFLRTGGERDSVCLETCKSHLRHPLFDCQLAQ